MSLVLSFGGLPDVSMADADLQGLRPQAGRELSIVKFAIRGNANESLN